MPVVIPWPSHIIQQHMIQKIYSCLVYIYWTRMFIWILAFCDVLHPVNMVCKPLLIYYCAPNCGLLNNQVFAQYRKSCISSSALTVSWPATPKSASLACPSVLSNMLPALMSRCIFLMKCRYSSPFSVDCIIVEISSSINCRRKLTKWANSHC